jgi:hypothetical protein
MDSGHHHRAKTQRSSRHSSRVPGLIPDAEIIGLWPCHVYQRFDSRQTVCTFSDALFKSPRRFRSRRLSEWIPIQGKNVWIDDKPPQYHLKELADSDSVLQHRAWQSTFDLVSKQERFW